MRGRIAVLFVTLLTSTVAADDWPQWGGPRRDLIWRESGIVDTLPSGQLPRVWSQPIGEGYAGPAVADGKVFVTDRQPEAGPRGQERVLCLDAETGKPLWTHAYDCAYTVSYPHGPRATPVIDGNRVYTIGAMGHMFCFAVDSGEVLWSKHFPSDFGTELPTWGMAASPLVHGEQLITLVGGDDALIVSFNKTSGEELWRALDDDDVGYCPPMLYDFGGQPQLIVWHPEAISSLDPDTGQVNWEVPFPIRSGLTIPTPRQHGNRLFVTSFYNGPMMLEVAADASGAEIVWRGQRESEIDTDGLHAIMCTPIFDGTHIYGVGSYGQLRCLEAATGKRLWETREPTGEGRWWNAFLIAHDPQNSARQQGAHRVFLHNEQGELILAELSPQGYDEVARSKLVEPTRHLRRDRYIVWSHPAFAMKSVFARNDKEIVRVDLSE